jgi:hypothetical protein
MTRAEGRDERVRNIIEQHQLRPDVIMVRQNRAAGSYSDLKSGRHFAFADSRVLRQIALGVQNGNSG